MPFTPVTYNTGAAPGLDGPAFNNMQLQYQEAINSFERDLFTPFVFSGLTATKDGVTPSKLNLASGVAFPLQTDNTLERRSISAQSFTTVTASTTYFLDLNPDGTLSWGTSHSGTANYLPLCSVATDGSGNISTVTDARTTATSLLPSMAGTVNIPNAGLITFDRPLSSSNQLLDLQQNFGLFSDNVGGVFPGGTSRLWIQAGGATGTQEVHIGPRNGSGFALAGVRFLTNNVIVDANGSGSAGTFKVQGGVKTSLDAGAIATDGSGQLTLNGSYLNWTTPLGGVNREVLNIQPPDGTVRYGLNYNNDSTLNIFNYTSSTNLLKLDNSGNLTMAGNISGPIGGGIPTTRNGAALSVPIYTGATSPSSPPTGSLWASA